MGRAAAEQRRLETISKINADSGMVYSGRGGDPRQFINPPVDHGTGNISNPPMAPPVGVGGGAAARDTLASLQAEAQALLAALDQQITMIAEKVAQGLVAELGAAGSALGQQMADGFKAPFAAFIAGTKSGKAAFGDFMDFVNQKIASLLAERFTNAFITPLFNGIFGAFGAAKGGVVGAPGGILAAGRAGATATRVVVNIANNGPPLQAQQTGERMEGNTRIIEMVLDQVEGALAANIGRGVGPLNAALGGSFGLQRQGR